MALMLRNFLLFAFCTGSLAASIPEGITLISSDGIPITHGGDERLVGIRGNLPKTSTRETPDLLAINAEYSLEQGSGVGDEPVSVVIPVPGRFSSSMAVVPDPTAVSSGPYRVVEQAEKSLAAKLHSWLAGLIPERSTSHLPEAYVTSGSSSASMTAVESDDVFELAGHLGGAVFAAFADFLEQAVKVSDAGCGYCVGNETEAFHSAVAAKIDSFCSHSLQFPSFCQFFGDLKTVTVSALLNKLGLNPIKLGVLRCTASEGPCHPNNPSTNQLKHFLRSMCRFVHTTLRDPRSPHSLVIDSLISLALQHSMTPPLEPEAGSCSACMKLGVDLYEVAIFQKMEQTCASARCHHVQAACEFGRKHPFLTHLAVTRKLELWDRVGAECSLLNHCPTATAGPSTASTLFAFHILPKVEGFGDIGMVMAVMAAYPRRTSTSSSSSTSAFTSIFTSSVLNDLGLSSIAAESASDRRVARGMDAQVTRKEAEVVLGEEAGRDEESVGKGGHDGYKGKKWEAEEHGGEGGHAKAHGGFWKHKQHRQHRQHMQLHMHMRMHGEGHEQEERGIGAQQHKHKLKLRLGHGRKHKQEGGEKEEVEEKGEEEEEGGQSDAVPAATAVAELKRGKAVREDSVERVVVSSSDSSDSSDSSNRSTSEAVQPESMTVGKKKKQESGKAQKCSKLRENGENHHSLLCGGMHKRQHSAPEKKAEGEAGAGWGVGALKVVGSVNRAAGQVSSAVREWGGQVKTAVAGAFNGAV